MSKPTKNRLEELNVTLEAFLELDYYKAIGVEKSRFADVDAMSEKTLLEQLGMTKQEFSEAYDGKVDPYDMKVVLKKKMVEKQYKSLSRVNHPDKGGNQEVFNRIERAKNTLSDPVKKREYDEATLSQTDSKSSGTSGEAAVTVNDFVPEVRNKKKSGDALTALSNNLFQSFCNKTGTPNNEENKQKFYASHRDENGYSSFEIIDSAGNLSITKDGKISTAKGSKLVVKFNREQLSVWIVDPNNHQVSRGDSKTNNVNQTGLFGALLSNNVKSLVEVLQNPDNSASLGVYPAGKQQFANQKEGKINSEKLKFQDQAFEAWVAVNTTNSRADFNEKCRRDGNIILKTQSKTFKLDQNGFTAYESNGQISYMRRFDELWCEKDMSELSTEINSAVLVSQGQLNLNSSGKAKASQSSNDSSKADEETKSNSGKANSGADVPNPSEGLSGKKGDFKGYYEILGIVGNVKRDFDLLTSEEKEAFVKKTYRKLGVKNHADKGGDPIIWEKMTKAAEVLSDNEKRSSYEMGEKEGDFKGYYKALGIVGDVKREFLEASDKVKFIKNIYERLAANLDQTADEILLGKMQKAVQILSDSKKRGVYDKDEEEIKEDFRGYKSKEDQLNKSAQDTMIGLSKLVFEVYCKRGGLDVNDKENEKNFFENHRDKEGFISFDLEDKSGAYYAKTPGRTLKCKFSKEGLVVDTFKKDQAAAIISQYIDRMMNDGNNALRILTIEEQEIRKSGQPLEQKLTPAQEEYLRNTKAENNEFIARRDIAIKSAVNNFQDEAFAAWKKEGANRTREDFNRNLAEGKEVILKTAAGEVVLQGMEFKMRDADGITYDANLDEIWSEKELRTFITQVNSVTTEKVRETAPPQSPPQPSNSNQSNKTNPPQPQPKASSPKPSSTKSDGSANQEEGAGGKPSKSNSDKEDNTKGGGEDLSKKPILETLGNYQAYKAGLKKDGPTVESLEKEVLKLQQEVADREKNPSAKSTKSSVFSMFSKKVEKELDLDQMKENLIIKQKEYEAAIAQRKLDNVTKKNFSYQLFGLEPNQTISENDLGLRSIEVKKMVTAARKVLSREDDDLINSAGKSIFFEAKLQGEVADARKSVFDYYVKQGLAPKGYDMETFSNDFMDKDSGKIIFTLGDKRITCSDRYCKITAKSGAEKALEVDIDMDTIDYDHMRESYNANSTKMKMTLRMLMSRSEPITMESGNSQQATQLKVADLEKKTLIGIELKNEIDEAKKTAVGGMFTSAKDNYNAKRDKIVGDSRSNLFKVLGLEAENIGQLSNSDATRQITDAYKQTSLAVHPDKGGSKELLQFVANTRDALLAEISLKEQLVALNKAIYDSYMRDVNAKKVKGDPNTTIEDFNQKFADSKGAVRFEIYHPNKAHPDKIKSSPTNFRSQRINTQGIEVKWEVTPEQAAIVDGEQYGKAFDNIIRAVNEGQMRVVIKDKPLEFTKSTGKKFRHEAAHVEDQEQSSEAKEKREVSEVISSGRDIKEYDTKRQIKIVTTDYENVSAAEFHFDSKHDLSDAAEIERRKQKEVIKREFHEGLKLKSGLINHKLASPETLDSIANNAHSDDILDQAKNANNALKLAVALQYADAVSQPYSVVNAPVVGGSNESLNQLKADLRAIPANVHTDIIFSYIPKDSQNILTVVINQKYDEAGNLKNNISVYDPLKGDGKGLSADEESFKKEFASSRMAEVLQSVFPSSGHQFIIPEKVIRQSDPDHSMAGVYAFANSLSALGIEDRFVVASLNLGKQPDILTECYEDEKPLLKLSLANSGKLWEEVGEIVNEKDVKKLRQMSSAFKADTSTPESADLNKPLDKLDENKIARVSQERVRSDRSVTAERRRSEQGLPPEESTDSFVTYLQSYCKFNEDSLKSTDATKALVAFMILNYKNFRNDELVTNNEEVGFKIKVKPSNAEIKLVVNKDFNDPENMGQINIVTKAALSSKTPSEQEASLAKLIRAIGATYPSMSAAAQSFLEIRDSLDKSGLGGAGVGGTPEPKKSTSSPKSDEVPPRNNTKSNDTSDAEKLNQPLEGFSKTEWAKLTRTNYEGLDNDSLKNSLNEKFKLTEESLKSADPTKSVVANLFLNYAKLNAEPIVSRDDGGKLGLKFTIAGADSTTSTIQVMFQQKGQVDISRDGNPLDLAAAGVKDDLLALIGGQAKKSHIGKAADDFANDFNKGTNPPAVKLSDLKKLRQQRAMEAAAAKFKSTAAKKDNVDNKPDTQSTEEEKKQEEVPLGKSQSSGNTNDSSNSSEGTPQVKLTDLKKLRQQQMAREGVSSFKAAVNAATKKGNVETKPTTQSTAEEKKKEEVPLGKSQSTGNTNDSSNSSEGTPQVKLIDLKKLRQQQMAREGVPSFKAAVNAATKSKVETKPTTQSTEEVPSGKSQSQPSNSSSTTSIADALAKMRERKMMNEVGTPKLAKVVNMATERASSVSRSTTPSFRMNNNSSDKSNQSGEKISSSSLSSLSTGRTTQQSSYASLSSLGEKNPPKHSIGLEERKNVRVAPKLEEVVNKAMQKDGGQSSQNLNRSTSPRSESAKRSSTISDSQQPKLSMREKILKAQRKAQEEPKEL